MTGSALDALRMRFEANRGQHAGNVDFAVRADGYSASLANGVATFVMHGDAGSHAVTMRPVDANPGPSIEGIGELSAVTNYLRGDTPHGWIAGVPSYRKVVYGDVWPGIDLVFRSSEDGELEYDFVVAPGANPKSIELEFGGQDSVSVDAAGDLVLTTASGQLRQKAPYAYQERDGRRSPVASGFVVDNGRVAFDLGPYDQSLPLVIDPAVNYATYLGGSFEDRVHAVGVDAADNVYVVGETLSPDFPTESPFDATLGSQCNEGCADAFVAKLDASGTRLLYATYLGGELDDVARSVAVHADCVSSCSVYVAGFTNSPNFPTQQALQPALAPGGGGVNPRYCPAPNWLGVIVRHDPPCHDAFVAVLAPNGAGLEYSTYFGGTGEDAAFDIAVPRSTSTRHVYVSGGTQSPDLVTKNGYQPRPTGDSCIIFRLSACKGDVFVAKIDVSVPGALSLVYSTYLGGSDRDVGSSIALDAGCGASCEAHVAGGTGSTDFPTVRAFQSNLGGSSDAFVARLSSSGASLEYGTYLGGSGWDDAAGIAVDATGRTFITGVTGSVDDPETSVPEGFPTKAGFQTTSAGDFDVFVAGLETHLDGLGSLFFASYLGGNEHDAGRDLAVTAEPVLVHVVGETSSLDFPTRDPVARRGIRSEAFVTTVDIARSAVLSSTHIGGDGDVESANSVAAGTDGALYVAGTTTSRDLPISDGAPQAGPGNTDLDNVRPDDGFVAKISPVEASLPLVTGLSLHGGPTAGGSKLDVTGRNLEGVRSVHFGAQPADFTVVSDRRISVTSPPHEQGRVTVRVTDDRGSSPHNPVARFHYGQGAWEPIQSPILPARLAATVALADGTIVVAGGIDPETARLRHDTVLFDPTSGSWQRGADLRTARADHTATLLDGGQILVVGGSSTPELYEPDDDIWTEIPPSKVTRTGHTATLLAAGDCATTHEKPDYCGKVLITGGSSDPATELYDPDTQTWTSCMADAATPNCPGPLGVPRRGHAATVLADGKIVVVGGTENPTVEIYDPEDGLWRSAGELRLARSDARSFLLATGEIFVIGGEASPPERFDPRTGKSAFARTPPHEDVREAVRLPSGKILTLTGGWVSDLHDPETNTWASAGAANSYHFPPTAHLIGSSPIGFQPARSSCGDLCGRVLVFGGSRSQLTELYTPPPSLMGLSRSSAPAAGGTDVTLAGRGLSHGTRQVSFGDIAIECPSAACQVDDTDPYHKLRVTVPPVSDARVVDVTVVNEGGAATLAGALTYTGPPGQVGDLAVSVLSSSEVRLSWSAVGQVAHADPPAGDYVVKLSRQPISSEADFDAATSLCGGVCEYSPGQVGDALDLRVGVQPGTDYHFAVKALDGEGVAGPMSNVVQVTTPGSGDSGGGTATDQPDVAPGRVSGLSAAGRLSSEIELVWSAAGSDGDGGPPAGEYVVKQSTEPIGSEADFESAFTLCGDVCRFAPTTVGEQIDLSVTGLEAETRYFYAVKAVDSAGNVGERSDTVSAATLSVDGVRRVFGAGRIQTAVELSRDAFPGGASHAVVARADEFPDALAASVLAAEIDGPVLLSESRRLSGDTATELRRLGAHTVHLAGGTAALSQQVADDLRAMDVEVVRLAGTDRIGTAAAIAREVARLGGKADTAIVVRADGFADALAAGPLAAYTRSPVLLTHTHDLPDETLAVLADVVDGGQVTIAGGTAAVGKQPQQKLEQAGYTVTRRGGADRYGTAVELADAAGAAGASRSTVFTASGTNFPDALAAAPAAWRTGAVLVLVDPDDLANSGATRAWLTDHADRIDQVLIAGGPAAVSDRVEDQLASVVSGS